MGSRLTAPAELKSWTAAVVAASLAIAPAARAAAAQPDEPAAKEPTAKERVAQGIEFYNAGNYEAAIAEFKLAYDASASPAILFPWAQAERLRGRCREAIDLYQRFIDSGPPEKQVEAAKQNRDDCKARIESADAAAASLVPGAVGEAPASEPPPEPEPPPPLPVSEPEPPPPPRRTDAIGWALLGAGVATGAVGGALLFLAARSEEKAAEAASYDVFAGAKDDARGFRIGGGVAAGAGLALLIAGAVRLGLHARKQRAPAVAGWLDGRGAGLSVGGRF